MAGQSGQPEQNFSIALDQPSTGAGIHINDNGSLQISTPKTIKLVTQDILTMYSTKEIQQLATAGILNLAETITTHGKAKVAIANGNQELESSIVLETPLMSIENGIGKILIDKITNSMTLAIGDIGISITLAGVKLELPSAGAMVNLSNDGSATMSCGGTSVKCTSAGVAEMKAGENSIVNCSAAGVSLGCGGSNVGCNQNGDVNIDCAENSTCNLNGSSMITQADLDEQFPPEE